MTQMAKITLSAAAPPTTTTTGIRDVITAIRALGYDASLAETEDAVGQVAELTHRQREETRLWLRYFLVSCGLTLPMMLVMWLAPARVLEGLHAPWQCGGECVSCVSMHGSVDDIVMRPLRTQHAALRTSIKKPHIQQQRRRRQIAYRHYLISLSILLCTSTNQQPNRVPAPPYVTSHSSMNDK